MIDRKALLGLLGATAVLAAGTLAIAPGSAAALQTECVDEPIACLGNPEYGDSGEEVGGDGVASDADRPSDDLDGYGDGAASTGDPVGRPTAESARSRNDRGWSPAPVWGSPKHGNADSVVAFGGEDDTGQSCANPSGCLVGDEPKPPNPRPRPSIPYRPPETCAPWWEDAACGQEEDPDDLDFLDEWTVGDLKEALKICEFTQNLADEIRTLGYIVDPFIGGAAPDVFTKAVAQVDQIWGENSCAAIYVGRPRPTRGDH